MKIKLDLNKPKPFKNKAKQGLVKFIQRETRINTNFLYNEKRKIFLTCERNTRFVRTSISKIIYVAYK